MRSLAFHCTSRDGLRNDYPDMHLETKIMMHLRSLVGVTWSLPPDFMTRSHFDRAIRRLDWTSSPGYPYLLNHPNNQQMFGVVDGEPNVGRCDVVWEMVRLRLKERDADPIRLFIKQEPIKRKKLDKGAYRLISSVSVVDQIIDHMLFADLNEKFIQHCNFSPVKVGWTQLGGGWKFMPMKGWKSIDKSRWDWSACAWIFEFLLKFRYQLLDGPSQVGEFDWVDLASWRYRMLFGGPIFITSSGVFLKQKQPGVMKSGCVNTIIDNSLAQVILHLRVCFENGWEPLPIAAMGDDTIQESFDGFDDYVDRLSQYCLVKQVTNQVEFAGHRFDGMRVEPLYKGKHAFVLLHLNDSVKQETLAAYSLLYHRSAFRDLYRGLFERMGANLPPVKFLDMIYDGEN